MSTPLQSLLQERCQTIRGAALALEIDPPLFNAYVHGKRPNQRNAQRIADGLKVKVRELWPNFDTLRGW